jgi:hypothetical protein
LRGNDFAKVEAASASPGHVLLQTSIGVIDTKAWMQGIPHWFFLLLARAMVQRQMTARPVVYRT